MDISEDEENWLKKYFPDLKIDRKKKQILGTLNFTATYINDRVCLFPTSKDRNFIKDFYNIKIDFSDPISFPLVNDIDGKIKKEAKEKSTSNDFIHVNPDNSLCIALPHRIQELSQEIKRESKPLAYLFHKIIQFLYHQSYVLKFKQEPWEGHAHSDEGIMNYASENPNDCLKNIEFLIKKDEITAKKYRNAYISSQKISRALERKIGRNKLCPCGSNKKYKRCHLDQVRILKTLLKFLP